VAISRSLFVATPPLILALLDEEGKLLERDPTYEGPDNRKTQAEYYLTGQVIAAYVEVRLTPQDFGGLASGHF
jgi:hypothetical protein